MPWRSLSELLGLTEGGAVRSLAGSLFSALGLDQLVHGGPVEKRLAFTIALIALCAKMSKADGVATLIEAEAFEDIYRVPEHERVNVHRLFDLAKKDVAGFEYYARRLAGMLEQEPELRINVLHALFHIALADRVLHETEEAYLKHVAQAFGCNLREYRAMRALFVRDESDPYIILGVDHDWDDDAVKAAYRKLVRQYHPDVLTAQGVPEAFVAVANEKIRSINAAYEAIARERGL